jgi:hypothetical protein
LIFTTLGITSFFVRSIKGSDIEPSISSVGKDTGNSNVKVRDAAP